jgi:hypothetical protein
MILDNEQPDSKQEEIRSAISRLAGEIKPKGNGDSNDRDAPTAGEQLAGVQQRHGATSVSVHFGGIKLHNATCRDSGPSSGSEAGFPMTAPPPIEPQQVFVRLNRPLLTVSGILWFCGVAPTYFVVPLPEAIGDMLGGFGFLSLLGGLITFLLAVNDVRR